MVTRCGYLLLQEEVRTNRVESTATSIGNRRTDRPNTDELKRTNLNSDGSNIQIFTTRNQWRKSGRIHIGFVPISPICCDGGCDCRGVVVIEALSSCFADTMNMSRFLNGGCMLPMFFSTASRRLSPTNMYFMWYRKSAIVSTNTRDVVWRHT